MSNVLALQLRSRVAHPVIVDAMMILFGSLFIALTAQITVPFFPVPFTGQTLSILLIGASFGSKRGALTVIAYLLEGSMGLPFFAGGAVGFVHLIGPTGGYLLGFILSAYVMGLLSEKGFDQKFKTAIPLFLIGQICIYTLGLTWLSHFVGFENVFKVGFFPFVLGEIIKTTLAVILLPVAWKFIQK
ncbi:MAG: biotin transporter BioY [Bacteriovoracaceae bacterium]|nr:biotin transporter BioY [Bacteriovoracaceae bacterium]